ncbi:hypothetical protein Golob_005279, partial [Gossypium lobatum]|nr:hypothetical protein [Gossypium lobatum]
MAPAAAAAASSSDEESEGTSASSPTTPHAAEQTVAVPMHQHGSNILAVGAGGSHCEPGPSVD